MSQSSNMSKLEKFITLAALAETLLVRPEVDNRMFEGKTNRLNQLFGGYVCEQCGKRYLKQKQLDRHVKKHH